MKSYSMRKLTKGVSTVNKANQQRAIRKLIKLTKSHYKVNKANKEPLQKLIEGCVNQADQSDFVWNKICVNIDF